MRQLLASHWHRGGSFALLDPVGANADLAMVIDGARAIAHNVGELRAWIERARGRAFAIVVQPEYGAESAIFDYLLQLGEVLLALDEAQRWQESDRIDRSLAKYATECRQKNASLMLTTRLPRQVHGVISGSASVVYAFRQTQDSYAEAVADRFFSGEPWVRDALLRLRVPNRATGDRRFEYLRVRVNDGLIERGRGTV